MKPSPYSMKAWQELERLELGAIHKLEQAEGLLIMAHHAKEEAVIHLENVRKAIAALKELQQVAESLFACDDGSTSL